MNILIIDDEKIIREAVSQLVEDAGHGAVSAGRGAAALIAMKRTPFDLVLLDINLGRESGFDLLGKIQQSHPKIPVVIFTSAATLPIEEEAIRRGALDFWEKPFAPEQLHQMLVRVETTPPALRL
ncbi:response regulator [Prosthecobacter sp.]|uniref:response regulator n=1 Tax=Prosthecobacter sp. TaxID=1965333 RepID=UPI0037833F94